MAGRGHELLSGIENFSRLNFSKIYHLGWYDTQTDFDIKEYSKI